MTEGLVEVLARPSGCQGAECERRRRVILILVINITQQSPPTRLSILCSIIRFDFFIKVIEVIEVIEVIRAVIVAIRTI